MGAIHGKRRFSCDGCQRLFSWRLDLKDHVRTCKALPVRNTAYQQQPEFYLLDVCFLCGLHLVGTYSEEASFIKGNQKLYHSKRLLAEVLEVITCDSSLSSHINHTLALCKSCMNSVNTWDETHQRLQGIAKALRTTYRMKHHMTRNKQLMKKLPEFEDEDGSTQEEFCNDFEGQDEANDVIEGTPMQSLPRFMKELKRTESLSSEKDVKDKEKEYQCDCGKKVHGLDALVEHQLRKGCKVKINEYPCKYCGSLFAEKKLLIVHKKECIKESLVNGAHECDICGRRFLVRGRVETHKRTAHNIGTADRQLCSYCGRTFGFSYNIKNHLAREHGIGHVEMVTCQQCGKKFSDRASFQNHVKNIHGDHKFECEYCGKKFATRGMRNHHINEMHNSSYNYKCNICGEQFKVSFKFRYHMLKMHSSIQHACDDCGRTFIMRSDLYRHVRGVHMGIRDPKRYPCKVCGRMFPSMYKVKRHASSHGILESTDGKNSLELESRECKNDLDLQVKQPDTVTPLIVPDETFVTSSLVKGMTAATLIQRKLGTITTSLADATSAALASNESSITRGLGETQMDNTDGTSIDIHQLPSAEIYTTPHITTLTPEILQGNMTTDVVAGETTMAVGSVSSIVVSASAVQECIHADDLQSAQQLHEHNSHHYSRNTTLMQPTLQSSLVPMHQMIVFEESITEPGQNTFSVRSSNQVISVSQCTNQVISGPQIPGQVICIPHSTGETSAANHQSQTTFSVPLTQHHSQVLTQQKLPTIQYEHYTA